MVFIRDIGRETRGPYFMCIFLIKVARFPSVDNQYNLIKSFMSPMQALNGYWSFVIPQ